MGHATASGYVVDRAVPFVALPSNQALGSFIRIRNPLNGLACIAVVLDIGPWKTGDHLYASPLTLKQARPAAEKDPATNGAGIDLGEKVWHQLGMVDNTEVEWEWVRA